MSRAEEEAIEKLTAAIHEAAETLPAELLEEVFDVAIVDYRPMHDLDLVLDAARAIIEVAAAEKALVSAVRRSIRSGHPGDRELREAVDAFEAAQSVKRHLQEIAPHPPNKQLSLQPPMAIAHGVQEEGD